MALYCSLRASEYALCLQVIGAGVAGLVCARELRRAGLGVEARASQVLPKVHVVDV